MQKTTVLRLANLVRIGCAILLAGLAANVGRAQGTIPSGVFQFTTATYSVSGTETSSTEDSGGSVNPSLLGARLTVTRSGGANGRVLMPVITMLTTNKSVTTISITSTSTNVTILPILHESSHLVRSPNQPSGL